MASAWHLVSLRSGPSIARRRSQLPGLGSAFHVPLGKPPNGDVLSFLGSSTQDGTRYHPIRAIDAGRHALSPNQGHRLRTPHAITQNRVFERAITSTGPSNARPWDGISAADSGGRFLPSLGTARGDQAVMASRETEINVQLVSLCFAEYGTFFLCRIRHVFPLPNTARFSFAAATARPRDGGHRATAADPLLRCTRFALNASPLQ